MDPATVLDQMSATRSSPADLIAPAESGVYALFLRDGAALPGVQRPRGAFLYIGQSSNLAQRDVDTHFHAGRSGYSTVRRSLGALLINELDLRPQPRGRSASKTNYRNYRFDAGGEDRLSAWMRANLDIALQKVSDPKKLERQLVVQAQPPLNLTLWANPDAALLKAARKCCVELARTAEPR